MTLLACQSQAAFQKWVQKNFFSFFRIGHFKNVHFQNFLKSLFRKFLEKNKLKQYKEHTERLYLIDSSTLIVYHYSNNSNIIMTLFDIHLTNHMLDYLIQF